MGFIVDAAEAVFGVIHSIVSAVVDVVASIVTSVIDFIGDHLMLVVVAVAAVYVACTLDFGTVIALLSTTQAEMIALEVSYYELATLTIGAFVDAIAISMSAFLEAIHFTTLLHIHQVAYILSGDYREMMSHVYSEISEVSVALGLGSGYLILAHRNARNVILDVSGMMGRPFDLAEITWLTEYSDYLKKFNTQVKKYQADPGSILHDIDDWLIKPAADLKASIMRNVITIIDDSAMALKDTVSDVSKLRTDLGQLITDLPPKIRAEIEPRIEGVFEKYDTWIIEDYKPALKEFDRLIGVLKIQQDTHRQNISGLVDRLKKPADYLLELDSFDPDLKREQENSIHELSTRTYMRQAYDVRSDVSSITFAFHKLAEALEITIPPAEWMIPEKIEPGRPAKTPVEPRKTWDVGDY